MINDKNDGRARRDELSLRRTYEGLRQRLTSAEFDGVSAAPLWNWVATSDRRLPKSLLDLSLRTLCQKSFDDIWNSPGIGAVKFGSLMRVLSRAARNNSHPAASQAFNGEADAAFNPDRVTEQDWQQFVTTLQRLKMESIPVGRLLKSLRELPSPLWEKPLGELTNGTLAELKKRPAFGEKRIRAILEALHCIHDGSCLPSGDHLRVRLLPAFAAEIEDWLHQLLDHSTLPGAADIQAHLIDPLLRQTEDQLSESHAAIVAGRVGIGGPVESMQTLAATMKLTRARIYQMLREVELVFRVRWPCGRLELASFAANLTARQHLSAAVVSALTETLYPG